ncbi:MAG: helix-turn-helix domain-containing protein [Candidatus Izemoplasmataceae bacterium]
MDNEKIGNYIKNLLKSKGMSQEELATKIGITPQAISKGLKGLNTFDIGNLKSIADLLGVTVDEILNANMDIDNEGTSDEQRLVLLGYNAVKSADEKILKSFDENGKSYLDYAVEQNKKDIIEFALEKNLIPGGLPKYMKNDSFLKFVMENELHDKLLRLLKYDYVNFKKGEISKSSESLWKSENEKVIEFLYLNQSTNEKNQNIRNRGVRNSVKDFKIEFLDQAIRFNNTKVIERWFQWLDENKNERRGPRNIPGLETAVKYGNLDYIKKIFNEVENNRYFSDAHGNIDILEAHTADPTMLEYILSNFKKLHAKVHLTNIEGLVAHFAKVKDYSNMLKYSKYAKVDSLKLVDANLNNLTIEELLQLFASGAMPSVIYNDGESVKNYVETVNKILLRLTIELVNRDN